MNEYLDYNYWQLPKIFSYWDSTKDAIFKFSRKLADLETTEKSIALQSIKKAISSHVEKMTKKEIIKWAFVMTDDLFRSTNRESHILDKSLFQYLEASAGHFSKLISEKGFTIHYIIDNTYEQSFFGMRYPLELYDDWFQISGFIYICPQFIALKIIEKQNYDKDLYFALLPDVIDQARRIADSIVDKCHDENKHYIFLDTDSVPNISFNRPMSFRERPNIITIFRNDAPTTRSVCKLYYKNLNAL